MRITVPKISIIIAVKNEELYIKRCLLSILHQTVPDDMYEIIVADGKSTDKTVSIIKEINQEYSNKIKIVNNQKEWQSAGRNLAIEHSSPESEYIVYLDGHCYVPKDWIEILYSSIIKNQNDMVAGIGSVICKPDDETKIGISIDAAYSTILGGFNSSYGKHDGIQKVRTVPYVIYKKQILSRVGCYDEDLKVCEDFILNYKLNKKGYELLVNPMATVFYYKKDSYKKFWKQMYNYGKGKRIAGNRYPGSLNISDHFPYFLGVFIFFNFSLIVYGLYVIPILFIIIYLLSVMLTSIKIAVQKKKAFLLWMMPISFFIEHVAYSVGFIINAFSKEWKR